MPTACWQSSCKARPHLLKGKQALCRPPEGHGRILVRNLPRLCVTKAPQKLNQLSKPSIKQLEAHEACERQFPYEKVRRPLILANLAQRYCARLEAPLLACGNSHAFLSLARPPSFD